MKKKKLVLSRKLNLEKDTVMQFSNVQMNQVAGGGDTIFQCQSNGCSGGDTRCMVHQPTFTLVPGVCPPPPATLYPCNPDVVGTVQGPTRP